MTAAPAVEIEVPPAVGEMALFERVDYQDAFAIDNDLRQSPEQWMRAFLDGAPLWFKLPWAGIATVALGAQLGPIRPGTPGYVVGWKVLDDGPEAFVIGLESRGGLHVRLVASTPPGRAIITTQIRLDTAYVRRLWPVVRRGHRFFIPYLLDRAARRLERAK